MDAINPAEIPENTTVRAQWIIGQLKIRRHTLRSLGDAYDIAPQALSYALKGPYLLVEEILASALGTKPMVLFKERYSVAGDRLYKHRGKAMRSSSARNAKVRASA